MTKILTIFLLAWTSFAFAQHEFNCGTSHRLHQAFQQNPDAEQQHSEFLNKCFSKSTYRSGDRSTVYVIPVVFHIIHEYGSENISDAQVMDQMNI